MPVPIIILGIVELATVALTAYEVANAIKDFYECLDKYNGSIEQAKKEIEKQIQALKDEIDKKIDAREEVQFLLAASAADPQGQITRKAEGRGAAGNPTISAAIQQKIPFRQVIGMVCDKANQIPVIDLRKKKGVQLSDLPQAKRKVLEQLLCMTAEELAGVKLEDFIMVRMKQLAANLMFEFIDHCIDWASPMKCEVSFGPKPKFDDHPLDGASATKLKRVGPVNPFYPAPHRQRGSISADMIIPEYRKKRLDKGNIFAIVEIKFQGDTINEAQFKGYHRLLDEAALKKTAQSTARFQNKPVNSGGRLSLFRYPEDMPVTKAGHDEPDKKKPGNATKPKVKR